MSTDLFGKQTENGMNAPSYDRQESDLLGVNERAVAARSSSEELEAFIKDSRNFILKQASAAAGRFITDSDEEQGSPIVTEILESLGADVHSARDGDIAVLSDGKSVWVE